MAENKEVKDNFVTIEDEDLPDVINFDETPTVVGRLLSYKTIKVEGKKVEAAILEHDGIRFGVWMSAGLDVIKTMKIGTVVKIKSLGLEKVKKGPNMWRRFEVGFDPTTGGIKTQESS